VYTEFLPTGNSYSDGYSVRVTLRLTVGQSVCLGVEPRVGIMTRCLLTV
jgi:hypothetical protein